MENKKQKKMGSGRRRAEAEHAEIKMQSPEERLLIIKSLLAAGLERMIAENDNQNGEAA